MKNRMLSKVDLTRVIKDAGFEETFIETALDSKREIATGDITFEALPCGIDIHTADVVENVNGRSTSEVDACISINVLLAGEVSFALEDKYFNVKAVNEPIVFINVISDKQLFTRYFCQHRQVKKFNLSVTKHWLLARCRSKSDEQTIHQLFASQQAVYQGAGTNTLVELVKGMFDNNLHRNNPFTWQLEQQAFEIFSQAFEWLIQAYDKQCSLMEGENNNTKINSNNYEKKIENILYESYSLEQIAKRLGSSISTLQRHFKVHHQLTLKEYIRNQKLEHARRSLIFENKSIGEVAYHAGYNHVSNFTTAFKKYFDITPANTKNHYRPTKAID